MQARDNLDSQVMALADEIDALVDALAQGYSPAIRAALTKKEAELEIARAELEKATAAVASSSPASVTARLADLRRGVLEQDPRAANLALRQLVTKVSVDFGERMLTVHWRASDRETNVIYGWPAMDEAEFA